MDDFSKMSMDVQARLLECGRSVEDVSQIMDVITLAAKSYEIKALSTDIIVYDGIPRVVDEYLAFRLMDGLAKKTIINYKDILYAFFRYVRKPYDEITCKDIRLYMLAYQHDRERPVCNRTMNHYQIVILGFFSWLQDIGYMTTDPSKGISPIKYEKTKKPSMTRHDLIILTDACANIREKAIISLLYATGCRVSEIIKIKKDDIDWHDKSIPVLGKGNKHRTVYFNDQAEIYVKQYLESRKDDSPYVVVSTRGHHSVSENSIQKMVSKIYNKVKDQLSVKVSPHIVRHTTTTLAIESGMPVTSVQAILGHSSLNTTMEYVDMTRVDVKRDYQKFVV